MTKRKRRFPTKIILNNYNAFAEKVEGYQEVLLSSDFYKKLCEDIRNCFNDLDLDNIKEIICYGIGNFTECLIAKYQLALLLLFKSHFKAEVYIYDPVFTALEEEFLKNLQLTLIDHNEQGARVVDSASLFFMPHCPTPLVNNLLWRNWSPKILNCIVLGNSFQSLASTQPEHKFKERFSYIHSILPYTRELEIENNFKYTDIFNDMAIHYFSPVLSNIPSSFWGNKKKPVYDETEVECITNKLKYSKLSDEGSFSNT